MESPTAIVLRRAVTQDSRKLWEWRNHPQVRKNFFDDRVIPWEEHQQWFDKTLRSSGARIYMAEFERHDVGVIRFDAGKNGTRVSVNLDPEYFGQGLGVKIIQLGTAIFLKENGAGSPVLAEIKTSNSVSQKAFRRAGYRLKEENNGKVIYEKCAA